MAQWLLVAAIWGLVVIGVVVAWYAADLPDVNAAFSPTRRPMVTVLAADRSEIGTVGDVYGRPVDVNDLPPALLRAVLAIEDRRFYHHFGVDLIGVARAVFANLQAGGVVQGGSTITQQAAKNLFLTHERTLKRKIQELLLALWLEQKFTKDQILSVYLNRAYFGAGLYGVDAAARRYFNRPAAKVSTYQAAMLAGLLKAPSRYNPLNDVDLAHERTRQVLAAMVDAGYLSEAEAGKALAQPGTIAVAVDRDRARYFMDWVLAQIPGFISTRDRDLVVATTLDPNLQRFAEKRLAETLDGPARKVNASQAALVAMAMDGAVRAMVGGRDYEQSSFNRATQAYRQPGSAFKPFVYLAGLEAGLLPESRFIDGPLSIGGWRPDNFNGRYLGEVTARTALAESINTVAVQVSEYAGRGHVIDVARRFGVGDDLQATPSVALGVGEVSPLELTAAYAAIANGGIGVWPYGIREIRDAEGNLLYARSGQGPGRAVSPEAAAVVTDMLVDAVENGTGRAARLGRPVAGKTGTSQNFRDAWFVGFSADLICGVWLGNDNGAPMKGVTGGSLPARLWRDFMADAHAGLPPRSLPGLAGRPDADPPSGRDRPPPAVRQQPGDDKPNFFDRLFRVFGIAAP
jgi:penicillin-binding protein 1A